MIFAWHICLYIDDNNDDEIGDKMHDDDCRDGVCSERNDDNEEHDGINDDDDGNQKRNSDRTIGNKNWGNTDKIHVNT